jgi:DUF4097 and DUF4098 domain-containing protein YvlB
MKSVYNYLSTITQGLKSGNGTTTAKTIVHNNLTTAIKAVWVDFNGNESQNVQMTIGAGQTVNLNSADVSHEWRVYNGNQLVTEFAGAVSDLPTLSGYVLKFRYLIFF